LKQTATTHLREYNTVARVDNYFAEYRMLFSQCRGNECDIFEIAKKSERGLLFCVLTPHFFSLRDLLSPFSNPFAPIPTMGKQLVNVITCGCESSAPFFVIYKTGREPTPYW
jgi:hypothetical protein